MQGSHGFEPIDPNSVHNSVHNANRTSGSLVVDYNVRATMSSCYRHWFFVGANSDCGTFTAKRTKKPPLRFSGGLGGSGTVGYRRSSGVILKLSP